MPPSPAAGSAPPQHQHSRYGDDPNGGDAWQPPTGALAWGYPEQYGTDVLGSTPAPEGPTRGWLGLAAAILTTALLAGAVGGYVGYRSAAGESRPSAQSLRDPGATLGAPVEARPVNRPASSVAAIAARVLRSVVNIDVQSATESGTGSGVVLRSDGYILTNNHVVATATGSATITVAFNGGSTTDLRADVVGRDPETDLAVVKVRGSHRLVPAALGSSSNLAVGDPVVAIGSPLGLAGSVTSGIISALDRTVRVPGDGTAPATPLFDAIQTDAAINPGNSGGALVDGAGLVIGINSAIASLGTSSATQAGSIGLGFAIPVDEARSIAEQLIRTGKATHPAIGVSGTSVGADGQGPRGALVREVSAGGAAERAGLRAGDIITTIGTKPVTGIEQLVVLLRAYKVGDAVSVTYVRGGASRTARVVLQDKKSS